MHWCVLIEISMEIGMLNFWLVLLVTALMKETYFKRSIFQSFWKSDCFAKFLYQVFTIDKILTKDFDFELILDLYRVVKRDTITYLCLLYYYSTVEATNELLCPMCIVYFQSESKIEILSLNMWSMVKIWGPYLTKKNGTIITSLEGLEDTPLNK